MTKEELEQRKLDAKNTLAVLTALEEIIVERVGRDGFQEKVDSALDELIFVEKQLKKLNREA